MNNKVVFVADKIQAEASAWKPPRKETDLSKENRLFTRYKINRNSRTRKGETDILLEARLHLLFSLV